MKKHLSSSLVAALCLPALRAFVIASIAICFIHGSTLPALAQTRLIGLGTEGGAFGGGTVFQLNLDGSGLTALYDFESSTGNFPIGSLIEGDDGLLYGVTKYGGASGFGTLFSIEPDGSDHTVLFDFTAVTGYPAGSLLKTKAGILFGMTTYGDAGFGTAYRINQDGAGYQEVYRFPAENEVHQPGNLMQATNGMIYGTAYSGGGYMYGHAFRLNADGSEPVVLVHLSWEDAESPYGTMIQASDGALYGVSNRGGFASDEGIVFRLLPDGAIVTSVHHFNYDDGHYPAGSLVQAADGALYGMTMEGGPNNYGSLYRVTPDSSEFTVLQFFNGENGAGPVGGPIYYEHQLYGYTTMGGVYDQGVIFAYDMISGVYTKLADLTNVTGEKPMFGGLLLLNPQSAETPTLATSDVKLTDARSHSMKVSFNPGDGTNRLVVAKAGSAPAFRPEDDRPYSGDLGDGTTVIYNGPRTSFEVTGLAPDTTHFFAVFEYNTNYAGNIRYLTAFPTVASHRTLPYSNAATKLVGVTRAAGRHDAGTMFSMDPDGSDFTVLHNFDGITGGHQVGTFLVAKDGYLYGVSKSGGVHATGTLYKIKPDGTDHTVIYNFTRDNGYPTAPPFQTADGTLFGVSSHDEAGYGMVYQMDADGSGHQEIYRFSMELGYRQPAFVMQASNGFLFVTTYAGGAYGAGMILRMNPDGSDPVVVHDFSGYDGVFAYSVLTEADDGALYGVAHLGGQNGAGVAYKIGADGSDFRVIHNFSGQDGTFPSGGLTQGPDGALYGVTIVGGQGDGGVLYKVNPDGSDFQVLQYLNPETGRGPGCDLLLYENKLYGLTTNAGIAPEGKLNLWGGTVFLYDLETETFRNLVNLTRAKGDGPYFGGLVVINPPQPVAGVQSFSLIDIRTDEKIIDFDETVTIDVGDPNFRHWTIRANTYPDEVGSVVFKIDVQKKNVENKAPYLLAGHHLRALSPTPHILEAEAYSERRGKGSRLQSRAALISFINNTEVKGFEVLDTNGEKFQELHDGDVLNVQDPLLRNFNIRALLNRDADRGSVEFHINGEPYWTENQPPYIMVSGSRRWWGEPGLYTVTAIPYSGKNRKGLPGTPGTVSFYISDAASATNVLASKTDSLSDGEGKQQARVSIYPVPAKSHLSIWSPDVVANEPAHVMIWDMSGLTRYNETIQLTAQPYTMDLEQLRLQKGTYFIRVKSQSGTDVFRFLKE